MSAEHMLDAGKTFRQWQWLPQGHARGRPVLTPQVRSEGRGERPPRPELGGADMDMESAPELRTWWRHRNTVEMTQKPAAGKAGGKPAAAAGRAERRESGCGAQR